MKPLLTLLFLGVALSLAVAQPPPAAGRIKITFADGHTQMAAGVRRSGNTLLANIAIAAGVRGETGYPLASIRGIEFPNESQLKTAQAALGSGDASKALGILDNLVSEQRGFRTIPGNFWAPAAILKADALLALGRDKEAAPLLEQIASEVKDPDQIQNVRIAQAFLSLRGGRPDEAGATFDKVIAESKRPGNLAKAWQGKGESLLTGEDYDGALLAYLRVPIFYSNETAVMPPSLLGIARAYEGLRDFDRANETLAELVKTYPSSPEAAAAKAETVRIQKKANAGGF